jgi:hypothetical protein
LKNFNEGVVVELLNVELARLHERVAQLPTAQHKRQTQKESKLKTDSTLSLEHIRVTVGSLCIFLF